MWFPNEPVRKYLYGVFVPIVILLAAYGIIGKDEIALWLALTQGLLGVPAVEAARSMVTPVRNGDAGNTSNR